MVHKKYIKRGDKTFGPYLYQNYRKNGVTKTRYIGTDLKSKKLSIYTIFLIIVLALIALVLILIIFLKFNVLNEDFLSLKGNLFTEKSLAASVGVRLRYFNLTLPYGIYEPLCCDNNLKTGDICYEEGYVNSLTENGAVYCDNGDSIYSGTIQHRFIIKFNNLSINSGYKVQCVIETSGTESQPGNLFTLEETPGELVEQDFYLNYTFNRTSEVILSEGTALPWYIHNCSILNSSEDINLSDPVNKRIYVHKSTPWTDLELTKIISCEGGSSGVFMNNIDRCLRDSPENTGSSKEFLYAFNLYGGGTVEGKCYDEIDNDYWNGSDAGDDTCRTWWDNYIDRTATLLPGFWLNLRSGGVFSGTSFILDADNLDSIMLPNTNTLVENTINNNPRGYMKFRFKNPSMNQNKYNIFLYEVPAASSLSVIGNGPGIGYLTSANLKVTLQTSGNYTVNLICDNSYCDDGGYLDIVMIVNFTNSGLDGDYPIGVEFTFTAGPSDTGITQDVYFDSFNGLLNTNESQNSAATAENMCNDSKNNDLDISFNYDYINSTNPPNRIDFSRDCGDEECLGKTGPLLNGQSGICYYKNESLNYPLSCRDNYDNDWNDNYLTDAYGFTDPSLNYLDCKDVDCFRLGGTSNDIINNPCPAFENNSADWCGDGINNDFDYAELESSSGIHSSSCSFPVDDYIKVEQNSLKYLHTSRIYDLFDCRDLDCNGYDGNISAFGIQKCEYGKEFICNDGFDNDGLQLKDCEIGSPVGRIYAPSYNLHAEYDCSSYCRENVNSQETGNLCVDGKDNDWDFWYPDSSSFYTGIENLSGGIDCRWLSYNPDEDCNLTWMNVSGTGYWQPEKQEDIVQCQLGKELNCTDNFDNDIDRDSSNIQSGWQGKNDSFRVYNNGADCADYDCKNVKDSNGNYRDSTGTYACPINERYRVNSGGNSYQDSVGWCFDGTDNDLDGLTDCKDPDCLNAVNPIPGQNGLNVVLVCAAYELNSSAFLDNDVLTVSPDYCGNLRDDENNVAEDNPANPLGGVNWYDIDFNSINQPISNSPGLAVTDCGDDDCYRKFGSCAPCSSNEFVNWNSCFDGRDNDHDGVIDLLDNDCNGKIVNERGYNLTNNPITEIDNGGSCSNQYDDDNLGDLAYIHPALECRNEQVDCAGKVFGSDGRVCPSSYVENTYQTCHDNFDNDGVNGMDCYDPSCFAACGINSYNGSGPIYIPQNSSLNVGVTNLVYSKITKRGVDFYYTYSYSGTSNGANIYLDLGHATDKSKDINTSVFNTSNAVILSNDCPTCGFVLFKSQQGFLRVRGTTRGSGFSITLKVPSLNEIMNPENILASTSIGAAFNSTLIPAEVVDNLPPVISGIIVEPENGKIFVGDPVYMRGYNFIGYSSGQIHSGGAGWCKINITGAINLVLENPNGNAEKNCEYTTLVEDTGTYDFKITPYDYNGNPGTLVQKSLIVSSVAPIIYSKLTRAEGKRVFFTINNESLDSFAGTFNGRDGLMSARFRTALSYPYDSNSCFAIIRNESNNAVSIQKIESSGGYLTTCTANISIRNLNLKDGAYTITINATDGQGYSLETQRLVFYVCNNLSSKGEGWNCNYADFDVDGYTEGVIQPFNYSNGKNLYKLSCDSCPGINNTGQDGDGDGIDNSCDNDTLTICGNNLLEYSEECDDGNTVSGDGCSSDCKTETSTPGNGGGGGGGGGGATKKCRENWICFDWSLCKKLSEAGDELNNENKIYIGNQCNLFDFDETSCGFRIRFCEDLNDCSTILTKPETLESCYYIYQPNCNDGIQNQNEEGIDCGGSCEPCELPKIESKSYWQIWVLLLLVCVLIVGIIYLLYARKRIRILLVAGGKVIKRIGYVRKKIFQDLKVGTYFSWKGERCRIISKKNNKLYVIKTYMK